MMDNKICEAVMLIQGKKFSVECLKWAAKQPEMRILACCIENPGAYAEELKKICNNSNITILSSKTLYAWIKDRDIHLGISCFFPKRIKNEFIMKCRWGCINFHPAPLPEYRGVCTMCHGVLNSIDYWEATAHYIDNDQEFDSGGIILKKRIEVNPDVDTPVEISNRLYPLEIELFKETILLLLKSNGKVDICPQNENQNAVNYYSRKEWLEGQYITHLKDPLLDRKVKAFWWPESGRCLKIMVNGKEYGIIDMDIMKQIQEKYSVF